MEKEEEKIGTEVATEEGVESPEAVGVKEVTAKVVAAPTGDEPAGEEPPVEAEPSGEAPDAEDISDLIAILNEVDKADGGDGNISDIPQHLRKVLRFIIEKLVALRDAFGDPLFKKVLDDMVDQKEDGETPSLLVAVARNVPIEDIQELADKEEYGDVQSAVEDRIANETKSAEDEKKLYANFQKSDENLKTYCDQMGYEGEERDEFFKAIGMLRDAFADGILSMDELEQIDKMRNYDKDVEQLRSQLPEEPTKEVLPDKASIDAAMTPPAPEKRKPANSIETMAAMSPMTDVTMIGKRKRQAGRR